MRLAALRHALDRVIDPMLALALLALGLGEIWLDVADTSGIAGPRIVNTLFLLLVTVPLLWRRRYPLGVLAVIVVAAIAWSSAWYLDQQPPLQPFVALLLTIYTVAATREGPKLALGGFLVAAWMLGEVPALTAGRRPGDVVPAWLLLGFAWALGRVVHGQRALAATLAERAAQLEHEREEKARLAVELERARIARELHDVVTHNVSVMVVQAGVERRTLGGTSEATRDVLRSIEETGREALVELRRLLGVLRKGDEQAELAPQPSLERLEDLVEQTREAGLQVELRVEGERVQLPAGVELSAYRIVQEALTNVLKHAGPARAEVVVRYAGETLEVEVSDDGGGPRNGRESGHGLAGMRERVGLHGGILETGARDGGGHVVRARLPVAAS